MGLNPGLLDYWRALYSLGQWPGHTRMLRAISNKSWRQHPTKQQIYGHLPLITKTIQVKRTRRAGHCWRTRDGLISDILLRTISQGIAKAGRPARTYIEQDAGLKTYQKRWTIEKDGGRGSARSVLAVGHYDDFGMSFFDRTVWPFLGIFSSSSSSCRAGSMDIPDPLLPLFPIVHRIRQVFWTTSRIIT